MCSRYSLIKGENRIRIRDLEIIFGKVRYNVAPSQRMPVIVEDAGTFKAVEMKWGVKPIWAKIFLINAKSETIKEKVPFKNMLGSKCLVPADGFYEWTKDKSPIRFTRPNHELMCFAGLWAEDVIKKKDSAPITERKFVILTTTPNESVQKFHSRMPFIVQPEHYDWWLGEEALWESVLNFPDKGSLFYGPVNRDLNDWKNDGEQLLTP